MRADLATAPRSCRARLCLKRRPALRRRRRRGVGIKARRGRSSRQGAPPLACGHAASALQARRASARHRAATSAAGPRTRSCASRTPAGAGSHRLLGRAAGGDGLGRRWQALEVPRQGAQQGDGVGALPPRAGAGCGRPGRIAVGHRQGQVVQGLQRAVAQQAAASPRVIGPLVPAPRRAPASRSRRGSSGGRRRGARPDGPARRASISRPARRTAPRGSAARFSASRGSRAAPRPDPIARTACAGRARAAGRRPRGRSAPRRAAVRQQGLDRRR